MSLPTAWIDKIFEKLTLVYGQSFLRRWADIDLNAVKSDWGHELSGFENHPKAIAWALQNLPVERPPSVLEFRAIARKAPSDDVPRLDAPKADPGRIAAELAKLAPIRTAIVNTTGREWAHRILARHAAGDKINALPLKMAREVVDGIGNRGVAT